MKRVIVFLALTAAVMLVGLMLSAGRESVVDTLTYGLLIPGILASSGAMVIRRHPGHRIGWLFCALALVTALGELAEGYGLFAAARGFPGGEIGDWVIQWVWIVGFALWLTIFFLFPDGHLMGRGWRVPLWFAFAGCALALPGQALNTDFGADSASGENPFAVDSPIVGALFFIGMGLALIAFVAAIASLGLRLKRARGVERQQLKWFACAAGVLAALAPITVIFWYESTLVQLTWTLAESAVPVAAAVAILRYRLYDIDVVINRALVYGALTAMLAAAYLGGVLSLQFALSPVTERSDLAVAGSTLVVAGLFRPARARIQGLVDRRFFRSRYDAVRTLEKFSGRLREQLDLEALGADLRGVVRETVQPSHVTLWLRAPGVRR